LKIKKPELQEEDFLKRPAPWKEMPREGRDPLQKELFQQHLGNYRAPAREGSLKKHKTTGLIPAMGGVLRRRRGDLHKIGAWH